MRDFIHHCFALEERLVVDVAGVNLVFRVAQLEVVDLDRILNGATAGGSSAPGGPAMRCGILMKQTEIAFTKSPSSALRLTGDPAKSKSALMFRPDWNFENMGIGGLDNEFSDIFRRAFASRVFPPAVVAKLGINHVRGILLFGPPGTGKTLMARQIGKMLNGKEPKVVNGPEVLSKYVGQSEENVRKLFKEAEDEQKLRGDESDLHIIIFDEIDAVCRQRGSRNDGTGVHDTVVNQLLSKIDGVDALNNILLIGMTNRRDMIDEALLRPGRLEVQMEINLPDEKGRLQILRIHTARMRSSNTLDTDVSLNDLAAKTKNFSGAEIEGLVKSAASFAMNRQIDPKNLTKPIDPAAIRVTNQDFATAMQEVKPAFGAAKDEFELCVPGGIIPYGPSFDRVLQTAQLFLRQIQTSERTSLVSVLLEGRPGAGKTALAAHLALNSGFPYIKLIGPDEFIGWNEAAKCGRIQKYFEDAYKSPLSVIVVDEIERLLEYAPIGPRFSNATLQTLLVLLKRPPPKNRKLLIIGTTSLVQVLQDLEVIDSFSGVVSIPLISAGDEVRKVLASAPEFGAKEQEAVARAFRSPLPIKKLLMVMDMARQAYRSGDPRPLSDLFFQALKDHGLDKFI
jgi:vesicle-fusing ATPase